MEKNKAGGVKLFSVPDFIGDACKAIASRIRGAVASVKFDDFHKNSAKIIRSSVFGLDEKAKVRERFTFPANSLNITSVDIQSVEPVDQRTRDALQKSVQLAIEITTASQEASAKYLIFGFCCSFFSFFCTQKVNLSIFLPLIMIHAGVYSKKECTSICLSVLQITKCFKFFQVAF